MDDKIKSYRQALFKLDHQGRNNPEASASKNLAANAANAIVITLFTKSELTDVTWLSKYLQTRSCWSCGSRLVSALNPCFAGIQKLLACSGFDSLVTSTLHDAFLPIHADPLKTKVTAVSAMQHIYLVRVVWSLLSIDVRMMQNQGLT